MANNHVFVNNDDIIEIVVTGRQNAASVELMGREVSLVITQRKALGKPCLVLDNIVDIGPVDGPGRKLVVELSRRLDYDRLAMVGKGGIIPLGANLLLRATGQGYRARYFGDRDQAVTWLKEKQPSK